MSDINVNKVISTALSGLDYEPNEQQTALLGKLCVFASSPSPRGIFLLNGYAGTGKTSVVGAVIRALRSLGRKVVVLAPTGRAAKVAQNFSEGSASTIHKRIFRGNGADPNTEQFFLAPNKDRDTLFVVDEASMIPDSRGSRSSLLYLLVHHVYSSPGCNMILVGDEAQLPPVGQTGSLALDATRLAELGLEPVEFTLDIPVRQESGSGIIINATNVRHWLHYPPSQGKPELHVSPYDDVRVVSTADLADELSASWSMVGLDETLVVTRSNRRANNFNQAIRNMVMMAEEPLQRGDRLVIAKNDYYWNRMNQLKTFLANGDIVEVTWLGKTEKHYGRYFSEAELKMSDGTLMNANIMLRSLVADGPAIGREEMARLYNRVLEQSEGSLSHKIKFALEDPYYNALQAKYAYCVTCHKAQGGQWKHVYIDMTGIDVENISEEFYRWLYTAMTRATERLYFINPTLDIR